LIFIDWLLHLCLGFHLKHIPTQLIIFSTELRDFIFQVIHLQLELRLLHPQGLLSDLASRQQCIIIESASVCLLELFS
jgi:hypothetical protein